MKKSFLILAITLIVSSLSAQVGLSINDTILTSTGDAKSALYMESKFYVQDLLLTGKVQCELFFYNSAEAKQNGSDRVVPIVHGVKIYNCEITIGLDDVIKHSGQSTMNDVVTYFYSKVKIELEDHYHLTAR